MFHCYNYRCRENNRPLGSNEKPPPQAQLKRVASSGRLISSQLQSVTPNRPNRPDTPVVHLRVVRIVKLPTRYSSFSPLLSVGKSLCAYTKNMIGS